MRYARRRLAAALYPLIIKEISLEKCAGCANYERVPQLAIGNRDAHYPRICISRVRAGRARVQRGMREHRRRRPRLDCLYKAFTVHGGFPFTLFPLIDGGRKLPARFLKLPRPAQTAVFWRRDLTRSRCTARYPMTQKMFISCDTRACARANTSIARKYKLSDEYLRGSLSRKIKSVRGITSDWLERAREI